jgi:hypothetical protein
VRAPANRSTGRWGRSSGHRTKGQTRSSRLTSLPARLLGGQDVRGEIGEVLGPDFRRDARTPTARHEGRAAGAGTKKRPRWGKPAHHQDSADKTHRVNTERQCIIKYSCQSSRGWKKPWCSLGSRRQRPARHGTSEIREVPPRTPRTPGRAGTEAAGDRTTVGGS